jgi:hypothetical protein
MARRWKSAIAFVLVFTAGVGAASFAAANGSRGVAAHAAQAHKTMRATAAAAGKTSVRRIEAPDKTLQPNETNGSFGTCPKKAPHPVSGYWGTDEENRDGDLVNVRSTPVGTNGRQWEVSVKNVSAAPITMYVGVVCVK